MIKLCIEYKKERGIANINITGACFHTDNDEYVILLLIVGLEELMGM